MSKEEVAARVAAIAAIASDDEMAHHEEDVLHRDVLTAIRDGAADPAALAALALKTADIEFARWCA